MSLSLNSTTSPSFRDELNRYISQVNYILTFIQAFLVFFGIVGNLLALIVINRKSLRHTSSAVFITYLAIFDTAVLLLHAANLVRPRRNVIIHCSLTYLTDLATLTANWILVIITLERCIAVHAPLLAKRFCSMTSARHSMYILLTVIIVFLSSTYPFIYYTKDPYHVEKCAVRPNHRSKHRILQPLLFYGLPDIFLLSNLLTVSALCRRHQQFPLKSCDEKRQSDSRVNDPQSSRKQRQLTVMLITVSLSFYLFTTPAMIAFINELIEKKTRDLIRMKRNFLYGQISVVLLQLNNATNFLLYSFTGQRFRQATRQTFHEFSVKLRLCFHHYVLCNKQYQLKVSYPYRMSCVGNTTFITRSSCSPNLNRLQHRTSTM